MESVLKINDFNKFSEETQQEIQDYISGTTTNWQIDFYSHCDSCSAEDELFKVETDGGIIRVCKNCKKNYLNDDDKSLIDFVKNN